ncbi:MAG: arginyltransferase [Aureliella sp.]
MQQIDFLSLVSDEQNVCSYLPDQTARMPLEVPTSELTPERFDRLLEAGYRRTGWFFYRTQCQHCSACEPLRLEVSQFRPTRSQRRAQKLGDRSLRIEVSTPVVDSKRLELFNRHRAERELSHGEARLDATQYRSFLVNSHTDVAELSLWYAERLIAVSITDVGFESLSAVYCFFDPDYAWLSLGTYAILQQVAIARGRGFRWLYLGMMVAGNSHLNYKANYRPHERRISGLWRRFE